MRRTLPALFLPRSPLVVVLGQVRFAPILLMQQYVPKIQDELRRGFPGYRHGTVDEVTWNFSPNVQEQPSVETVKRSRWEFFNAEATWRIILTEDSLLLATSAYVTYEDPFEKFLRIALAAVDAHAGLQIATRLGLRYVDVIEPAVGESFDDYLHPRLLGVPAEEIGLHGALPYLQIRGVSDIGQMIVRCVYASGGVVIPPDLADLDLRITKSTSRDVAILDLDHFSLTPHRFDLEDTLDRIGRLHDTLDIAFRKLVTDQALQRWGAATNEAPSRRVKGTRR